MKLSVCFPKWLNHFILPTAKYESSSSPFSLILYMVTLPYFSHPSGYEWFLVVISVFISLMCVTLSIISGAIRPFARLLWWSVSWIFCLFIFIRCLSYYIVRVLYILLMSFSRLRSAVIFPNLWLVFSFS